MKTILKNAMLGLALMLAGAVGAATPGSMVTFSSPGPDAYPDGTPVVDGEYYALAWAADAAQLVMGADGAIADGRVLAKVAVAEGTRCPPVNVKLDNETANACKDGAWGVFLLDTRGSSGDALTISSATRIDNATIELASNGFLSYTRLSSKRLGAPGITDGVTDNPVAAIGTTGYATLADAIAAVPADGTETTITMLADETINANAGVTIPANKNVVLDLNGKTISQVAPEAKESALITNRGTLKVKDSTATKDGGVYTSGKITAMAEHPDSSYGYGNYTIENFGVLNIESGIVEQTSTGPGAYYPLDAREGGTVTISGGLLRATYGVAVRQVSFGAAENTLTITGGEIIARAYAVQVTGMDANQHSHLSISGGTLTSTDPDYELAVYVGNQGGNFENIYMDITGGTFNGSVATAAAVVEDNMSVSGGRFNGIAGVYSYGDQKFVTGGEFAGQYADYTEGFLEDGLCLVKTPDGYYIVKDAVAQIVAGADVWKYDSLGAAIADALDGDTVQLLVDIEDVSGTFSIYKSITIDGMGHSITAVTNSEPRNVVSAYDNARVLFQVGNADDHSVTITNITLNGGTSHYYTYLVEAKHGTLTVTDVAILNGGEADVSGAKGVGYGAGIHVNGATLLVKGDFVASTGGEAKGIFPYTGILYDDGNISFADGVTADIGDNLLLVGMGPLNIDDFMQAYDIEGILAGMNIPDGFIPYTLALNGTDSGMGFVGASPRKWNDIIDYGKEIMDVATDIGFGDMDKNSTPVEVGLLTDTVLPDTFRFADTNLTVNGNGNALSGTIEYTDNAGLIEDIVLGTESNPLVLDLTGVTEPIEIGSGISVTNVTVKMTPEQATAGTPVIIWDVDHGVDAPENEAGVTVQLVDEQGDPTGNTASLIWDDDLGVAYIGPCEARLTGPTHDEPIYTSLGNAITLAAQTGDTVTLLMNVTNVSTTYTITKQDLIIDGAGYKVTAAPVTEHRNMFDVFGGGSSMFKVNSGNVTFKNIELDGDATHAYTYLVSADNGSVALTTENVRLLHGGEQSTDANGTTLTPGNGYGAAIHLNRGAKLTVKDGFYACTGTNENGVTTGVFPFTAILPENLEAGTAVTFDLTEDTDANPTVDIGDDLLLVGMIGDLIDQYGIATVQGILDYMKVPKRFIPYTLTLADGSAYAFTGASPRSWNDIIDYGKDIMDVSTAMGFGGLDKDTTPVEVGLATDTELPGTFTYEDANFSVNGNGNALSGTIIFKDEADGGMLHDIELGADGKPLVLDLSQTTNAVDLGSGVVITNITVKMTEEQARVGTIVFDWNTEEVSGDDIPQHGTVSVTVVNAQGGETGETKGLIWDEEYGIAYIGPVEARLTGPTHETPIYTTLADALARALDGDTVKLLKNAVLAQPQDLGVSATLDLAGWTVDVTGTAGLLVTNATLSITNTVTNATDAITGTIKAGLEASPTSLIKSGEGGLVRIPMGIFAAVEGGKVLETADDGRFEVSGGYFSVAVLPEYCAAGYAPAEAETGAPQHYTVAEAVEPFVYPIEGTGGVPITNKVWLATQFPSIYPDATKPIYASITNDLVVALTENGANDMPKWESYVLGFDPRDPTAKLRLTASSKNATTVTITGVIDTTKFPEPTGTTVKFRLAKRNGDEWTNLAAGSETPSFDCLLEDVVGEDLAIFADIVTE